MTRRKQGLGLSGLLVLTALGVMAFAASVQAANPFFLVNGQTNLHASFAALQEIGVEGIFLVPASNLRLKCPEFEIVQGLLLTGGEVAHANLLYRNCKAFENNAPNAELPCHVSGHTPNQALLQVSGTATLLPTELTDGTFAILAENIVAKVLFLSGTGCPLPLSNTIKGEVCFKITKATNNTNIPLIESDAEIQGLCVPRVLEALLDPAGTKVKDKLLLGANEAFIDLKAELFGLGAHAGKTFGVGLI